MQVITLSSNLLDEGRSIRGGFSAAQLSLLGINGPLRSGWERSLIGRVVDAGDYARFVALKDKHLSPKKLAKAMAKRLAFTPLPPVVMPLPKPVTAADLEVIDRRGRTTVAIGGGSHTTSCAIVGQPCSYPVCMCCLPSQQTP